MQQLDELIERYGGIGAVAREHDIFYLVDACQSAGQIALDVDATKACLGKLRAHEALAGKPDFETSLSPIGLPDADLARRYVVWEDYRWGEPQIVTYDLFQDVEERRTFDGEFHVAPAIAAGRVAWQDLRGNAGTTPGSTLSESAANRSRALLGVSTPSLNMWRCA